MKKKVLSIFLALMLCLSLLPTAALAEEAGTTGAGDTLAAEQGEGNTVAGQDEDSTGTGQDEDSTVTGQDGDNSVTGQGEGDVLSEQSVSAAAFSSAAGTHSHENGAVVFAKKLSQNEEGKLQIDGETRKNDGVDDTYVLPAGNYYLETNLTLDAGIAVYDEVTLCLNGKRIEFKGDHTCINVYNHSFTLTDCEGTGTITHGNKDDGSKYPGNGVLVFKGTFHMKGGSITGNTTTSNGGGVYVYHGTFNMSGGSVTGNTATGNGNTSGTGGGVFVGEYSTFSMSGGSITGNTAVNGGGVWVQGGTFKVSGGVKISGNNKSDGSNSNVYLPNGKTISVIGALSGAEIGVTTEKAPVAGSPITIAEGGDGYGMPGSDAAVFFADDLVNYSTKLDGDVVQLSTGETQMVHPVCGKVCNHMDSEGKPKHPDVTWKPWSDATSLPYDGYYYLTVDVTLAETQTFDQRANVALDLNGKTVSNEKSSNTIESCGNVTLTDCRGGGKITHGSQKGLGVHVYGGTFDMYGGSITGNSSSSGGGGVWMQSGTFNLYDGSISGNETGSGGGVYMNYGTFNMYGGSISGNRAGTYGGGVYVKSGTFNLYGGRIDKNYSETYGGGVGMGGGTFNMTGGDISNNKAPHNGGVFVNGGEFNMSGTATISGNEATSNGGNSRGGGVRVDKGTFHMSGGSITDNKATGSNDGHGGGVYAGEDGTFHMSGTARVTDNQARCGGGVYVVGTFHMSGGSITGNKATGGYGGGGVYVKYGTFTVSGAVEITGNKWYSDSITNNVRLYEGKTITVNGLQQDARIGVSTSGKFATGATDTNLNYSEIFTHDTNSSEYDVVRDGEGNLSFAAHQHRWTYEVNTAGDTITAKCSGCSISGGSVTIQAPTRPTYDGTAKAAKLENDLNNTISVPSIIYAKGGTALDTAPVDAGEYTASITMGGVTATVTFKIAKADAPAPSGLTGYVGKALSTVVLPAGWTWVDGDAVMNTAGDAVEFRANYGGDNNHEPARNVAVSVKVVETSGGGSTGGNTGGNTGGGNTGGNTGGGSTGGNTGGGSGHRVSTSAPAAPAKLPTLLLGSRSSDVKTLQEMLNAKGYNAGSVDGIFGKNTRAAVIAFQNANGLAADGIVGKLTWAKLYDTTAALPSASTATGTQPVVYRGSRGDAVRRLQELLNKKGFDCGAVDGIFGSKTYAAVMAFQKANGLRADGIAGPLTWGKLG